jgi:selenocysteine-specific elongation factor
MALTGTDPDRWAEEKARGLTIDLGFAHVLLPSGREISFVDVPGHVRFIKNMLAGVGAVDACMFVVAATEGWKPQSEEHLRILQLLGLRHGVVALTKVGLCDDDLVELARLDVAEHVTGTFLEDAPVIAVDAPTGRGLTDLVIALDELTAVTPTSVDRGRPRLWVDRSFAARGSGTVVTGTLTGGSLKIDDEVLVLPRNRSVRVRGLQSLHRQQTEVGPGHRSAVNLVGITYSEVERGHALVRPGQWHTTMRLDASLHVLASLDHEVSRRGAYVAYLGSGEHPVKLRVLGDRNLAPGETGSIRLHLPWPVPLLPGDHYVLRESGRKETVGGGEVLDVAPIRAASKAKPDRSVDRIIAERGWIEATLLEQLTGERRTPTIGGWVVDPHALEATRQAVVERVDAAGPLGLDTVALSERERGVLALLDDVVVAAGRAKRVQAPDPLAHHAYLAALNAEPFAPPAPDGVSREELRELVKRGLVVAQDGVWFSAGALEQAAKAIGRLLADQPDGVTVADIRTALGNTRKHALPLLAALDAKGITRRRGDVRIAGPRMPAS